MNSVGRTSSAPISGIDEWRWFACGCFEYEYEYRLTPEYEHDLAA
ncbi:hypothetical protein Mal15_61680 [Stieleria maiorica]|uniref:Uncharacterized protein n=1 Tax=Stieleria maiorica TaxID=2795974 RepID=A0A5B9MQH8_9BACT|nr:hypothetical protein Mal15_61680 [Stieleria maiorica]